MFGSENAPKKILLTGLKFNLNTSSDSAIIKQIVEEGSVQSLFDQKVNRVKVASSLNSDFFSKSFSLF